MGVTEDWSVPSSAINVIFTFSELEGVHVNNPPANKTKIKL